MGGSGLDWDGLAPT
jgi:hypothetical protein